MGFSVSDLRWQHRDECRYWYSKNEIKPSLLWHLFEFRCSQKEIDAALSSSYVGWCKTGDSRVIGQRRKTYCFDVVRLVETIQKAR